jgi:hypothetical protein
LCRSQTAGNPSEDPVTGGVSWPAAR